MPSYKSYNCEYHHVVLLFYKYTMQNVLRFFQTSYGRIAEATDLQTHMLLHELDQPFLPNEAASAPIPAE